MLTAIRLDDELGFTTKEIGEVAADALLPDEFEPAETPITQVTPELSLGVRLIATQPAAETGSFLIRGSHRCRGLA